MLLFCKVYFVVALLHHTQSRVIASDCAGNVNLADLLSTGDAFEGFDLEACLRYVDVLATRHRDRCLAAMSAYLSEGKIDGE